MFTRVYKIINIEILTSKQLQEIRSLLPLNICTTARQINRTERVSYIYKFRRIYGVS